MLGKRSAVGLAAAALLGGCSESERAPLPLACTDGGRKVERALAKAPGEVRLEDGTPLSQCVGRAVTDAELQSVGIVLTEAAEHLEDGARTEPRPALQLGYLIGAARRGAPGESSIQAELVHRLERSASIDMSPEAERALAEGMRAGERNG